MASIVDQFASDVFHQLNVMGLSFQAVCNYLANERKVVLSRQALRQWYLRRQRKIAARAEMSPADKRRAPWKLNDLSRQFSSADPSEEDSHFGQVIDRSDECRKKLSIQSLIQEEEQHLLRQQFRSEEFPVRRKSL